MAFKTFQISHQLQKMKKVKNVDGVDDIKWKFFCTLQFIIPGFILTRTTSNMVSILILLQCIFGKKILVFYNYSTYVLILPIEPH